MMKTAVELRRPSQGVYEALRRVYTKCFVGCLRSASYGIYEVLRRVSTKCFAGSIRSASQGVCVAYRHCEEERRSNPCYVMDCFTPFAMTEKEFAMTEKEFATAGNGVRHCETARRSNPDTTPVDCFTPFATAEKEFATAKRVLKFCLPWKSVFLLPALIMLAGCYKNDIDELKNDIGRLKEQMAQYESLLNALDKRLGVTGYETTGSHYVITLSDGSQLSVRNTSAFVEIGTNGNWHIDGADTGTPARGNAPAIAIGANGNWHIDG
ncbi:MAG: DUF4988 domain-containing protein, partial [Bacteroidales bacterium]|nr:DUF4988 domain-containing protein [Bacteroidales bacterium]